MDYGRWAWVEWTLSLDVDNLDLDENLVPIQVEEDETLDQHDLDILDLNGKGDENDGVEGLYWDYEFNLQDYLL